MKKPKNKLRYKPWSVRAYKCRTVIAPYEKFLRLHVQYGPRDYISMEIPISRLVNGLRARGLCK